MDPKADNYNPQAENDDGTCVFIAEDGQEVGKGPDLRNYVTTMLSRVWGNAVTSDRSESTFKGSGYPFSGDIVSRRDIERLVSSSLIFIDHHSSHSPSCPPLHTAFHLHVAVRRLWRHFAALPCEQSACPGRACFLTCRAGNVSTTCAGATAGLAQPYDHCVMCAWLNGRSAMRRL